MEIRIRATGQVMLEDELRRWSRDNGGPSWDRTTDEVLEALGADVVFEGPQAQPTRYQVAFRDGVEQVDGRWFTKYSVADLDDEAKAAKDAEQAKAVRADRNQKLGQTDWTQGKDIADNISTAWATYRQALRDVPSQAGFPWTVQWPTQPE
jgi:hypothetical protein